MKRIRRTLEEVVDDRRARQAAAGTWQAGSISSCRAACYAGPDELDPITALIGRLDGDPVDDLDSVVTG